MLNCSYGPFVLHSTVIWEFMRFWYFSHFLLRFSTSWFSFCTLCCFFSISSLAFVSSIVSRFVRRSFCSVRCASSCFSFWYSSV